MASLSDITVKRELRPCLVNGKKALFHTWEECADIIQPSPMVGGHNGGVIKYTTGIIEDETGRIYRVSPTSIQFLDRKIEEYCFNALDGSSQEVE